MQNNKVNIAFRVQSHEVDCASRLKPFYLQCYLQEAGYAGSAFCGAGFLPLSLGPRILRTDVALVALLSLLSSELPSSRSPLL